MKTFSKVISMVLVVALMLSVLAIPALAATPGTVKTKTAGSSVTLREKASTGSKSLGSVKDGTAVSVTAKSGDFYKVTVGGKKGYILKSYIVLGSSSTSTGSSSGSSSSSSKTTGKATKAAYMYKSANTTSTKMVVVKKDATFEIHSQTTSFYKITYNKQTGYILKKYVELVKSSSGSGSGSNTSKDTSLAGDKSGVYTTSTIPKPADVVSAKQDFWNAISYNLINFKDSFSVKVKNYSGSMMPTKTSNLEYAFTEGAIEVASDGIKDVGNNVTQITFNVKYNEAGRVLQSMINKKDLPSSDTKAIALKKVVDKVLTAVKGKSDYNKIVYIHDYVVLNVGYDEKMSTASFSAYGALIGGKGSCQGYAEATALLLSAAGIENRLVWANSKMGDGLATHGFNKVKLDNKWYNVDCTVDDPKPDEKGRIKRDFLLVTDKISKQRYDWDTARYPASSTDNNWHKRNKLVATSQSELESIVKAAVAKKQEYVSVWVNDFSNSKYKASFASKLSGAKLVYAKNTPASSGYTTYGTAILFKFTY